MRTCDTSSIICLSDIYAVYADWLDVNWIERMMYCILLQIYYFLLWTVASAEQKQKINYIRILKFPSNVFLLLLLLLFTMNFLTRTFGEKIRMRGRNAERVFITCINIYL